MVCDIWDEQQLWVVT